MANFNELIDGMFNCMTAKDVENNGNNVFFVSSAPGMGTVSYIIDVAESAGYVCVDVEDNDCEDIEEMLEVATRELDDDNPMVVILSFRFPGSLMDEKILSAWIANMWEAGYSDGEQTVFVIYEVD